MRTTCSPTCPIWPGSSGASARSSTPDGVAVIEVPYVRDLIERTEFDTIYHEHLCYFSVTAFDRLVRRHRLRLREVERIPIHGGSLRLLVTPAGQAGESVRRLLGEEVAWGVDQEEPLVEFARGVEVAQGAAHRRCWPDSRSRASGSPPTAPPPKAPPS